MKAGGSSPRQPSSQSRVPWFIAMAVVAALGTLLGIVQVFGTFMGYDDEGYMMAVVGRMLSGKVLYKEVPTVYGPFYFLFKHVLHAVLGIPLTNNATRVVTCGFSLSVTALLAITTFRMTRSSVMAAWAATASIFHLWILAKEPGHPQELIALALAGSALAALSLESGSHPIRSSLWIGFIAGVLVTTKINVGALYLASLGLAVCLGATSTRLGKGLLILSAAVAILLPFAILGGKVTEPRNLLLAVTVSGGLISITIVSAGKGSCPSRSEILGLASGGAVAAMIALSFALFRNSTVWDLYNGLVAAPRRLAGGFVFPTPISIMAIPLTLGSWLLATMYRNRVNWLDPKCSKLLEGSLMFGKLAYVLWVVPKFLADPDAGPTASWGLLAPGPSLLWLVLIAPPSAPDTCSGIGIRMIACIAALQPMQAFPTAGSQCAIGTILLIPVALQCLWDFLVWTRPLEWLPSRFQKAAPLIQTVSVLLAVALLAQRSAAAARTYLGSVPLPAASASWIRVDKDSAETFGWLIRSLNSHGMPFVCTVGFNSLHLWTGLEARTPVQIGNSLDIFSQRQLEAMMKELDTHPECIVVDHPGFFAPPLGTSKTNHYLRYVVENYETYDTRGSFRLMIRKGHARPSIASPDALPPQPKSPSRGQ